MMIRLASEADAGQGIKTLRRSISELCTLDHRNDPQEIRDWLQNKSIASWCLWVSNPTLDLYVADKEGEIVGVGLMSKTGEILLNYVSPDARFRGVSKALLSHMGAKASSDGLLICSLESTKTARQFYLSQGYTPFTGGSRIGATMTKKTHLKPIHNRLEAAVARILAPKRLLMTVRSSFCIILGTLSAFHP